MANTTSQVDGLDICTAIVNINGVAAASIQAVNVWNKKSCAQADCNPIELGLSTFNCARACVADCRTLYTDAAEDTLPSDGSHIYQNSECECSGGEGYLYYSNKCGGRSGMCWTVRAEDCSVFRIESC